MTKFKKEIFVSDDVFYDTIEELVEGAGADVPVGRYELKETGQVKQTFVVDKKK